jgi:4-amino-4-deoxy-L-arabinose transferase-like glycosyltransferase
VSSSISVNRRFLSDERSAEVLLGLIIVVAAAVRFGTLGAKSFWGDEGYTIADLHGSLAHTLHRVDASEDTPPPYFVLAWGWSRVFGLGEAGVRSLSALLGTLTVPVSYAAAGRLVSRRAALTAAALVSVDPLLVWYGQEARGYALLVFLGALSVYLFVRAIETRGGRAVGAWAAVSVLMLYTHYFGFALVAAEGAWLLWQPVTRRRAAMALIAVAVCAGPLVPTLLAHVDHGGWVARMPFFERLLGVPGTFLVGFEGPHRGLFAVIAGLMVIVGVGVLIGRGTAAERRGALIMASVGAMVILFPLIMGLLGYDRILYRYMLLAVVPLAITVGAGLGARRAGWLGPVTTTAFCALSLVILGLTAWTPKYGTQDWRAVAASLRPLSDRRAVLVYPRAGHESAVLSTYLGAVRGVRDGGSVQVREVDVVAVIHRQAGQPTPRPPRYPSGQPGLTQAGFRLLSRERRRTFALSRFTADTPRTVGPAVLAPGGVFAGSRAVLLSVG